MTSVDNSLPAWSVSDFKDALAMAGLEWTAEDEAFWTPARIAACREHWEREWERTWEHWFPLHYYKEHGITPGLQYVVIGQLAARYARDFPWTQDLADELWEVLQASENSDRRKPWTYRHALNTAERAHRFIERADQAEAAWMPGLMTWAERANREARNLPRHRQPRVPGTRERRRPGREHQKPGWCK